MKKFLIALLLLAAAGAGVYYFVINKPHKDVATEEAIDISAPQLFAEFTANEQIANKKFLNKAIQVSGTITTIDENQDKKKFVVLQTDDMMYGVMCTMRDNEVKAAPTFAVGDKVSIKGFCSGFVGDVKLTDCVLTKTK